jgi:DNA polymerase III subunit gamma/tau
MSEQYQVSARKYRPLQFEDVVGQGHISGTLKNAMSQGKVAHAFLFCGPRGVGKTTCARILARTLNCLAPDNHEPCGVCTSCTAFQQGQSFNIVELDAASNNSVDHIRSLNEQVRFAPQSGKYKVFIIDEVHMLSAQAFNAFLKTLEEPPPYAVFILATTEKHKILPTILSRCQIFDFKRITVADTVAHLDTICKKEGIKAEAEALHVIGQKADGALRDALSIFDRVAGSANGNLTYAHVIEQLNVLDSDYFFKLTDLLLAEDHAEVLNVFDEILAKGFDAELFINAMAEHMRNVLMSKDERTLHLLEMSDTQRVRFGSQGKLAPDTFLLSAIHLLNECEINLRMARNRRLHTELYLLKIAYIGRALNWNTEVHTQSEATSEKKKPEPSIAQVSAAPVPKIIEVQPEVSIAIEEQPEVLAATTQILHEVPLVEEPKLHELAAIPAAPSDTELTHKRSSLRKSEGAVSSLSMDAYAEAVAIETSQNAEKVSKFGDLAVLEIWNAYAAAAESAILRSNMQLAQITLNMEQRSIHVLTHNGVAREMIVQEKNLLDVLRADLHEPLMRMIVEIDATAAEAAKPQVSNRPLNEREKFEMMANSNPSLLQLKNTLGLKLLE